MTSPISSNWFYYMTMASMARAMPQLGQAGNSVSPLGGAGPDSSFFMMLLQAAMQGGQTAGIPNAPVSTLPSSSTQVLPQLNTAYKPAPIPSVDLTETVMSSPIKTDLNFKPVQFIKLENTLDGKLSGAATHFINAGKKYDIDPNLLSAIAIHETGNGSSRAAIEKNNVAGMMGRNGLRSYGSVEESIFDMARNLRQNYLDEGKTTVAEIGAKYAPVGATNDPTGLNNHWTTGVSRQLNNLA